MTRAVFYDTPLEIPAAAAPLYADLAALRMRLALVRLARKYNFDPAQPRVPAGSTEGGRWTDAGGSNWTRVAANARSARGMGTEAGAPPADKTLGLPASERDKARRKLVLHGGGGNFHVAPNPAADATARWYADPSKSTVAVYDDGIIFAANKQGVDADLIRSIMYVETTQGHYFGVGAALDDLRLSRTILPMNIHATLWRALGTREQLENPFNNIMAGAKILKGIEANLSFPDVAVIGTLYNALDATEVSDYGARVAAVYRGKPWLKH